MDGLENGESMMRCPACQRDIPANQPICPHCGARMEGAGTIPVPGEPASLASDNTNRRIRLWGRGLVGVGLALLLATLHPPLLPYLGGIILLATASLVVGLALLRKARPKPTFKPWERPKRYGDALALFGVIWALLPHNMSAPLGLAMIVIGLALRLAYVGSSETQWRYVPHVMVMVGLLGGGYIVMMWMDTMKMEPLRARQSEARTNLGGVYVAEKAFFEEHKRYGTFEEIGYTFASKTNRYTYRIDVSGKPGTVIPANKGEVAPDNTKVPAGFSATRFTATATANIDSDTTIDQWHVNDAKQGLQQADVDDATD